ncbi:hypothetical protein ABT124_35785 [Streptomyces sp. NPDC001982]
MGVRRVRQDGERQTADAGLRGRSDVLTHLDDEAVPVAVDQHG